MVRATVEGTEDSGYIPPDDAEAAQIMDEIEAGFLGTREQILDELDLMVTYVRQFWHMEPDEVMQVCSAYNARLTEVAMQLQRVEAYDRQYKSVRTQQVQRLQDELERQFRIHSRMLEVRRQDITMSGGMR